MNQKDLKAQHKLLWENYYESMNLKTMNPHFLLKGITIRI